MEPSVVLMMKRHGTVKVLISAVQKQQAISIYIQDQVRVVNLKIGIESSYHFITFTHFLSFSCYRWLRF